MLIEVKYLTHPTHFNPLSPQGTWAFCQSVVKCEPSRDCSACLLCVSVVIMMYVRARQVCQYVSMSSSPHPVRVNKASFFFGLLAAFGMTLVANFQVCESTLYMP